MNGPLNDEHRLIAAYLLDFPKTWQELRRTQNLLGLEMRPAESRALMNDLIFGGLVEPQADHFALTPVGRRMLSGQPEAELQAASETSPLLLVAQEAFRRDLPKLLDEHQPGEWVAYLGSQPWRFGRTKRELYRACLRANLQRGEFLVRLIDQGNLCEGRFVDVIV